MSLIFRVTNATGKYVKKIETEALSLVMNNLKASINDSKWRVRLEALNAIVDISLHFSVKINYLIV